MSKPFNRRTAVALGLFLCGSAMAQETDWLEIKEGFEGKKLGAQVREIKLPSLGAPEPSGGEKPDQSTTTNLARPSATTQGQSVGVAIPKHRLKNRNKVREVIISGRRGEDAERLPLRYEWATDYDDDHYGLMIYLDKLENLPIRLYFKTDLDPE